MKMRSKMQNQKGFTLVELMVVVVILGILVAIAVPVYQNIVANAEQNAIESNIRILDSAISMYSVEKQITDVTTLNINSTEGPTSVLIPYLQEWPEGPKDVKYAVTNGKAGEE